jgi:hypothetical protein
MVATFARKEAHGMDKSEVLLRLDDAAAANAQGIGPAVVGKRVMPPDEGIAVQARVLGQQLQDVLLPVTSSYGFAQCIGSITLDGEHILGR